MVFRDRQGLKAAALQRLEASAYDPRKLMLIYVGGSSLLMLAATVLSFVLDAQIAGTGGLGGVGMRTMLQTAIEVLRTATNLILPFWNMGYLACVLKMVRGQEYDARDLLTGFRHFGPVLRLNFLYGLQFLMLGFLCFYPSMLLFTMTPLAAPLMEILEPYLEAGTAEIVLDETTAAAVADTMMPMMILYAVVFLVVAAPRFYNYRMAFFALLDDPKAGARMALHRSTVMMRRKRLDLLKLDMSFWWFYVLDGLATVLCFGDAILMLLGIPLPVSVDGAYFLFYVLYLAAQLGLYVWARNRVECTYAMGYEGLLQAQSQEQ